MDGYIHTYTCICIHTHIYTYTYIYRYTHIYTLTIRGKRNKQREEPDGNAATSAAGQGATAGDKGDKLEELKRMVKSFMQTQAAREGSSWKRNYLTRSWDGRIWSTSLSRSRPKKQSWERSSLRSKRVTRSSIEDKATMMISKRVRGCPGTGHPDFSETHQCVEIQNCYPCLLKMT